MRTWPVLLALLLAPTAALAQGTPIPPATTPGELPLAPPVQDPMLAPMPPAQREVRSWEDALVYVRARSTDLRVAYDEAKRAEAQSRVALAGTLPSLTGQSTATHQFITNSSVQIVGASPTGAPVFQTFQSPTPNYATGSLVASQPLLALRAWYAIGTAKMTEDISRLSVEDVKRQIAVNVSSSLVGVVTAERVCELNRVGLRNALERLELTTRKRNLGAATGLDVVRAQQDVESARSTLVTGDESLRQAREALGLALGVAEPIGISKDLNLDGLERSANAACRVAATIEERADVAAARGKADISRRGVNDVWYQFAPTVNAQSSVTTTTLNTGSSPNTTWNIQAVLSMPLWEGGARYGLLHDARLQVDESDQKLEALRRTATIDVVQSRRGISVAEESRRVAANARGLAAEVDRLTRTSYLEGRGTSLELVVAASALRQADITLALREFDLVKARILAILTLARCDW